MPDNETIATPRFIQATSRPPEFDSDVLEFETWLIKFENFLTLSNIEDMSLKRALLIESLGTRPFHTLISLCRPKVPKEFKYDELIEKLKKNYQRITFKSTERCKFFSVKQTPGQSLTDFANIIKDISVKCQFPEIFYEDALITAFVTGLSDEALRRQLLQKDLKAFDSTVELARTAETIISSTLNCTNTMVNKTINTQNRNPSRNQGNNPNSIKPCYGCGGHHLRDKCRFKDAICYNCGKKGHISKVCKSSSSANSSMRYKQKDNGNNKSNFVQNEPEESQSFDVM